MALDLPGHGRSAWSNTPYSHMEYSFSILRALEVLGWRRPERQLRDVNKPSEAEIQVCSTPTIPVCVLDWILCSLPALALGPALQKHIVASPSPSVVTTPIGKDGRLLFLSHSLGAAITMMTAGILGREVLGLCQQYTSISSCIP